MKTTRIIGFAVLVVLWVVLSAGVTLYNLLIVAFSGIIIFVPLWRKLTGGNKKQK